MASPFIIPRILLILSLAAIPAAPESAPLPEYLAKARILRLLLDYVEWPKDMSDKPIVIGVLDPSPFGNYLSKVTENVVIQGRPLVLRSLRGSGRLEGCDVLFIPENADISLNSLLRGLQDKSVLTVADTPGYSQRGVIVNLALRDNRIRLEVNLGALKKSGIIISPQVLKGATITD